MTYYTYIMTNKNNTVLYIGVTNDIERRTWEHAEHEGSMFTQKYNVNKLVYYEDFSSIEDAIAREKQIKNWHRQWKINLIKKENPGWKNLANTFTRDAETSSA